MSSQVDHSQEDDVLQESTDYHENEKTEPVEDFNKCQWVCLLLVYGIFLFLVSFIIYMSFTWDKVRINEYTWKLLLSQSKI